MNKACSVYISCLIGVVKLETSELSECQKKAESLQQGRPYNHQTFKHLDIPGKADYDSLRLKPLSHTLLLFFCQIS